MVVASELERPDQGRIWRTKGVKSREIFREMEGRLACGQGTPMDVMKEYVGDEPSPPRRLALGVVEQRSAEWSRKS